MKIEWKVLKDTWEGLGQVADQWKPGSREYMNLIEVRRLTEVEMREQGYEEQWAELTGGNNDADVRLQ